MCHMLKVEGISKLRPVEVGIQNLVLRPGEIANSFYLLA